jgi:hypothetical protein
MNTDTIIRRLDELGVTMTASGNRLDLRPGSRVPEDLQVAVRLHKLDLIDRLPPELPDDRELAEIVSRVWKRGYVLLWSSVLQDTVAFTRTWEDSKHVPLAFTVYTLDELVSLFNGDPVDEGSLRSIHSAKQLGGRIVDARDINSIDSQGETEHE